MVNPCILHQKEVMVPHTPVISIIVWKWSIHYTFFSATFNLLYSSITVWKAPKHLSIKVTTMKIWAIEVDDSAELLHESSLKLGER